MRSFRRTILVAVITLGASAAPAVVSTAGASAAPGPQAPG